LHRQEDQRNIIGKILNDRSSSVEVKLESVFGPLLSLLSCELAYGPRRPETEQKWTIKIK
jgi:hypothetical protein